MLGWLLPSFLSKGTCHGDISWGSRCVRSFPFPSLPPASESINSSMTFHAAPFLHCSSSSAQHPKMFLQLYLPRKAIVTTLSLPTPFPSLSPGHSRFFFSRMGNMLCIIKLAHGFYIFICLWNNK